MAYGYVIPEVGPNLCERALASIETIYIRYHTCAAVTVINLQSVLSLPLANLKVLQRGRFQQKVELQSDTEYCQVIQSTRAYKVATRVIQSFKICIALIAPSILAGLSILTTRIRGSSPLNMNNRASKYRTAHNILSSTPPITLSSLKTSMSNFCYRITSTQTPISAYTLTFNNIVKQPLEPSVPCSNIAGNVIGSCILL